MKLKQSGFTLVEIAIVLVIIGLLLGGILKGQEMITAGQVRNMVTQSEGVTAAVFAFQDRFKSLPGDFARATSDIPGGGATANGNGNGLIDTVAEAGDAWQQLSLTNLVAGNYDGADVSAVAANWTCPATTCPPNVFGGTMILVTDDEAFSADALGVAGLELYSGQNVPVAVMLEIDTKLDDGLPDSGSFQISATHSGACDVGGTGFYTVAANPEATCGGVYRNF